MSKIAPLLALLCLSITARPQNLTYSIPVCQTYTNCYTASTGPVVLSAAGTAATIQQPATGPWQQVAGVKLTVQCSVACAVTRSKGGTAATSTAAQTSIVQSPLQPLGPTTALFQFFTASDSSGGTTVDVVNVAAGETKVFDLSDVGMSPGPTRQPYTVSIGAITGTANITFYLAARP